jgi:two-component system, OmpR family, sensor histidine kinase KdpD
MPEPLHTPEPKSADLAMQPPVRQTYNKTQSPDGGYHPSMLKKVFWLVGRHIAGLSLIAIIMVSYVHGGLINAATVGFVLLLAILCASTLWGLGVAVVMSVAATLCYDFFVLPPVGTFNIADSRDWVALFSFTATGVIGSYLSARARRQAKEANRRRREAEGLYDFSQRLLRAGNPIEVLESVPRYIVESFGVRAATLLLSDGQQLHHWGDEPATIQDAPPIRVIPAPESGETVPQSEFSASDCVVILRMGGREVGSLRLSGVALSDSTIRAMETLIAIAVERARMIEDAGKIEAARENERLKSVLLDAITHDFRTPLTSIKGSATGLLADVEFDREQQKELLLIIDEECDRINRLIDEASEIARLEAGEIKVDLAPHAIGELISSALAARKVLLHNRPILFEITDPKVQVLADLSLSQKVLLHLIDNADLYSSEDQPITLRTEESDGFVAVSVSDRGPGIEEAELGQIFEKFYRGKNQRHRVAGTGMGLAIAKAIVEAHGGTIGVVSKLGEGSVFTFRLPLATEINASAKTPRSQR